MGPGEFVVLAFAVIIGWKVFQFCSNRVPKVYKANPHYIVRRLDPFVKIKQKCDKCQDYGYDYIILDKSQDG